MIMLIYLRIKAGIFICSDLIIFKPSNNNDYRLSQIMY